MGKVLLHATMSLDGYIARPDDAMDWVFAYSDPDPTVDEVIRTTGAMLAGRRSYEVGVRDGEEAYGGAWHGPQFVLTHDPPERAAIPDITFVPGSVRDAVATALEAAGGKNVVVTGADVAQQCLDEGLVDEILVHVAPVLLRDGVRLFDRPCERRIELETMSVVRPGKVSDLRFRVVK